MTQSGIILFRTHEGLRQFTLSEMLDHRTTNSRWVTVDAAQVSDWFEVQARIWRELSFPTDISPHAQAIRHISWDAFDEWLGDLSWLDQELGSDDASSTPCPVVIAIENPRILLDMDAVQYAILIVSCFEAIRMHERNGRSFTLILGPVDSRLGPFMNTLRAHERYVIRD